MERVGRDPDGARDLCVARRPASSRPRISCTRASRSMLGVPEVISTIDAVLGLTLVKAKFRAVMGYPGKAETRLALLRNEVNVDSQSTPLFETERAAGRARRARRCRCSRRASWRATGSCAIRRRPICRRWPKPIARFTAPIRRGPAWEAYKAAVRAVGNGGKILLTHSDAPAGCARSAAARRRGHDQGPGIPEEGRVRAGRLRLQPPARASKPRSRRSARWRRQTSPGCRTC